MKAKELIEILQEDPEREVVMASDSEGNSFDGVSQVSTCKYNSEEREIGLEKLTLVEKKMGYSEEDVMQGGVKAFVLWP